MSDSTSIYSSVGTYSSKDLAQLQVVGMRRNGFVISLCSVISLVSIIIYGFQFGLVFSVLGLGISSFLVGLYLNEKYLLLSQRVLIASVFIIIANWTVVTNSFTTTLYFIPLLTFLFFTEHVAAIRWFYVSAVVLLFCMMFSTFYPNVGVDGVSVALLNLESITDCILSTLFTGIFLRNHSVFSRISIEVAKSHTNRLKDSVEQVKKTISLLEERRLHLSQIQHRSSLALENERAAAREIRASQDQLEQFAYAASHDLKEPIRTVRSFYQVIRRRLDPEVLAKAEIAGLFELVECKSTSMHNMLERLLLYSRVSSAGGKEQVVSLTKTLKETLVIQGASPDLRLETAVESDEVFFATGCVRQVFQEVVSNAIKFSVDGRPPALSFRTALHKPGFITCSLEDNGLGIAKENLTTVLGLFQRLQADVACGSSGLGLSIAKAIVNKGGGDLWLTSDGARGTTVHFELPTA